MTALTRTLTQGDIGLDVEGARRALIRYLRTGTLGEFNAKPDSERQTFDKWAVAHTKSAQKRLGLPADGQLGPQTEAALRKAHAFDALADDLIDAHNTRPKLVQPNQGWGSLHKSLWTAYSIGRSRYGFTDLGTYNPASKLPSGRPSDHAVLPAVAFDLGISPDTGWGNAKARAYCLEIVGRPEIAYVIVGDRIWTSRRRFWGAYHGGGHMNHIHVSGNR